MEDPIDVELRVVRSRSAENQRDGGLISPFNSEIYPITIAPNSLESNLLGVSTSEYYNQRNVPEGLSVRYNIHGRPYLVGEDIDTREYIAAAQEHNNKYLSMSATKDQLGEHFGNAIYIYFSFIEYLMWCNLVLVFIGLVSFSYHAVHDGLVYSTALKFSTIALLWRNGVVSTYTGESRTVWQGTTIAGIALFINRIDKMMGGDRDDYIQENAHIHMSTRIALRFLSYFLVLILVGVTGGITFGIVLVYVNSPSEDRYPWASPLIGVIYALINQLWRRICLSLTRLEKHRTWTAYRRNNVIKFFLLEMANIIILYTLRYIVTVDYLSVFRFNFFGVQDENLNKCTINETAEQFLSMLLSELFIGNALEIVTPLGWRILRYGSRMDNEAGDNDALLSFDLATEYLELFYRQFIIALSFTLVPLIGILGILLHGIHYGCAKYKLLYLMKPPPRSEGSMKGFTTFFVLIVAVLSIAMFPRGSAWILLGFDFGSHCKALGW
ncbi:hypothetical protein PROFUN_12205 [Planoprotostelium fungivorum]|uniref:Anoctamin transmembrane domain-containing protein n=1 Tax=Planoprotostelium fungivorum TaxID=1890364 RepID=A0A2P6N850_9EUKA|nr:hypothetical protein PROFUN_12205 [Planoprotostelium fungivorum]